MSTRSHHRNTAATDASVTKCIDEVNSLGKELSKLRSDFSRSEDMLPANLRTQNMEITNKIEKALQEHKAETTKNFYDLQESFKKENAEKAKKWDEKYANFVTSLDSRLAEYQKTSQKRIDALEAEINKSRANFDTDLLNLRGDFKKGDTKLEQHIIELEDKLDNIMKRLQDLSAKLNDEANERNGVKSDLDANSEKLSCAIDDLKKYIKEVLNKKDNEIDDLAQKFDGNRNKISSCEVKADQISQSLQSSEEKGHEFTTELGNIQKWITELGANMNAQFSKIPDEIDQKIQIQSNTFTNMLNDVKKDSTTQLNTIQNSVNELSGNMNGKFAQSLEANHALAIQANDNIAKITEQQNSIRNQMDELENIMSNKHATAIQQINEVRNLNNKTQKDIQDLSAEMLSSLRVKRQVCEYQSGNLTPQRENGEF